MCNKCEKFHSNLCQNHKCFMLDKNISNLFTGFCTEEKHQMELEFFCKTHNQLCCPACISKIQTKESGKHKDCNICLLEEIKNEKISKLKDNIKYLEELSNTLLESINRIKEIYAKINVNKDELKLKIQKIFTKIRNELNNREDKLLLEIDQQYDNLFFKEEIIKECEKLPNKVKLSLEKSKIIDLKNNELNSLINSCLDVENNIININIINDKISKFNEIKDVKIDFYTEEGDDFIEKIKIFGKLKKNRIKKYRKYN